MARPKAGTLPSSEDKPQFEQDIRDLEAKIKADAARATMEAMTSESGELPGGVQGSVDEAGAMRFSGGSGGGAMPSEEEQRAVLERARKEREAHRRQEAKAADTDFRRSADFEEVQRVGRQGIGYVSGPLAGPFGDPEGPKTDPETGVVYEYNESLGVLAAKVPKDFLENIPDDYKELPFNVYHRDDGNPVGFEYYYIDEAGNPNKSVINVAAWAYHGKGGDAELDHRIVQVLQNLQSAEYLTPEQVAYNRRWLEGSAE